MRCYFILLFAICALSLSQSYAQSTPLQAIEMLFDGMRAGDGEAVNALFHPAAQFFQVGQRGDSIRVMATDPKEFGKAVSSWAPGFGDERFGRPSVRSNGLIADVWMDYEFYADGKFSHCGSEVFTLVRQGSRWQIVTGMDTRQRDNCESLGDSLQLARLDTIMNRWHHAAAVADEDVFFGTMSADGIYLGTDKTERWLRDSMAVWADPFFQRETAWAFTPLERHWYLSADGQTAWFEEHLDSWMGVVRGSGVLTKVDDNRHWELRHYNLAMAVPNERMDAVRMAIDSTAKAR